MHYIFTVFLCLILLGAGCSASPQSSSKNNTVPPPIIIGGTERDPLGPGEQCLINGDCELGESCIEGICVMD